MEQGSAGRQVVGLFLGDDVLDGLEGRRGGRRIGRGRGARAGEVLYHARPPPAGTLAHPDRRPTDGSSAWSSWAATRLVLAGNGMAGGEMRYLAWSAGAGLSGGVLAAAFVLAAILLRDAWRWKILYGATRPA